MSAHQKKFRRIFVKNMVNRTCLGMRKLLIRSKLSKPLP